MNPDYEDVTFSIDFKMPKRYAQCFVSMLDEMVNNGKIGHSAWLGFYSDGDGVFRPSYKITKMSEDIVPKHKITSFKNVECEIGWDGG